MELKTDSTIPIFIQIADMIEDQILKNIIKEEEKVYSTNELSTLLHVNPATARKGLNILVDENIVYKKRGVGMFVKEGAVDLIKLKRKKNFMNDFIIKLLQEGEKLGISKDEIINMINNCTGGFKNE
ncbi:GntR family transcriptional regulator [Abyssisolibacter fermentans]|uniref:GntR family transcriptional regulator n=1 Tax=Abyssisolibacter fermentans TaxID=1766203 RepID=UPI00083041A8|nr:GntR family transcriptional regulator [Abyssisolibacter fermentans]